MFYTHFLKIVTYIEEFSSVLVTISYPDSSSVHADIKANSEVLGQERLLGAVPPNHHLPLEEDSLRSATVDLFGLVDHDGVVLEIVVEGQFADAVVFQFAFHHALLEITEKS